MTGAIRTVRTRYPTSICDVSLASSYLKPVIQIDESSTLEMKLVCDAEVWSRAGDGASVRFQDFILKKQQNTVTKHSYSEECWKPSKNGIETE